MAGNRTIAARHPKVIMLHSDNLDISSTAAIIAEQVDDYHTRLIDGTESESIITHRPPVILFALKSVTDSINYYKKLMEDEVINYPHKSILLCMSKESGLGFRSCIKGLFDNYFVYVPLYEKFRLKIIVHSALLAVEKEYQGVHDEKLEKVDEGLAELIEQGVACRNQTSKTIKECKLSVKELSDNPPDQNSTDKRITGELLQSLRGSHLDPLLDKLENELNASLSNILEKLIKQRDSNNKKHLIKESTSADHQQKNNSSSQKAADNPLVKKKVLVVEDNMIYRQLVVKVLEKEGMLAEQADDGIKAIQKINTHQYDLVLMDLFMPKMNGLNTTKTIRKQKNGEKLPIIALTGNKNRGLIKKWAEFGLHGYILKPSTKAEILSAVHKALGLPSYIEKI
jgi:CheY-like chemotaxis protein